MLWSPLHFRAEITEWWIDIGLGLNRWHFTYKRVQLAGKLRLLLRIGRAAIALTQAWLIAKESRPGRKVIKR